MPKTRKAQAKRGTRTGVETNPAAEDESIEQWIESTKSPTREDGDSPQKAKSPSAKNKAVAKKTKTPKQQVSMNLPGAALGADSEAEDDDRRDSLASAEAKNYSRKVTRNGARTSLTSPSDLSRVSTAPPTPKARRDLPDEEDQPDLYPAAEDQEEGSDIENALLTQEDEDDRRTSKETTIGKQAAGKGSSEKSALEANDDDFGPGDGDADSEEGDPLAPPVADDSTDDEKEAPQTEKDGTAKKSDNIDGLDSDDEDQFDNDDNDDGPGYNLVHDPETPDAVRAARAKKEKEDYEKLQAKKKKRKSDSDTDTEATDSSKTPKPKKSKKQKNKKQRSVVFSPQGIPIANRDYQMIPIGAFVENSPEEESGPRRSKRARVKPLEYWRGEKMQLGPHEEDGELAEAFGNMPVVKEIQKANPTPYKKKKATNNGGGNKKTKSGFSKGTFEEEEFDSRKLRRKYKFIDGEDAYLWDDSNEDTGDQKVISYASKMEGSDLPLSKHRKKSEGKVTGKAAQAFNVQSNDDDNYVGYIMGNLLLPPKGIKDSESVGPCAQTFTVCACQPKALEIAYGDPDNTGNELDPDSAQRFLLGPGDMFRVPPGNSYRLENHSTSTDCLLTWTIIRPKSIPTD